MTGGITISCGVEPLAADDWLDRNVGVELLGPVATSAYPVLRTMLDEESSAARTAAAKALDAIEAGQ